MSLRIVARGAFATGKVCLLATSPTGSAGSSAAGSACGSSFWLPSWALASSFAASSVFVSSCFFCSSAFSSWTGFSSGLAASSSAFTSLGAAPASVLSCCCTSSVPGVFDSCSADTERPRPLITDTTSANARCNIFHLIPDKAAAISLTFSLRLQGRFMSGSQVFSTCFPFGSCSRQIINAVKSAGLTPEMRLACPKFRGRMAFSFSRASRRSPSKWS